MIFKQKHRVLDWTWGVGEKYYLLVLQRKIRLDGAFCPPGNTIRFHCEL